jgi:hypothetical protein
VDCVYRDVNTRIPPADRSRRPAFAHSALTGPCVPDVVQRERSEAAVQRKPGTPDLRTFSAPSSGKPRDRCLQHHSAALSCCCTRETRRTVRAHAQHGGWSIGPRDCIDLAPYCLMLAVASIHNLW